MPEHSERAKRILKRLDDIEKKIKSLKEREADLQHQLQVVLDEEWGEKR